MRAAQQRMNAFARYYDDPNRCLYCDKIIDIKDHEKVATVRLRKFCNRACCALHTNNLDHGSGVTKLTARKKKGDAMSGDRAGL